MERPVLRGHINFRFQELSQTGSAAERKINNLEHIHCVWEAGLPGSDLFKPRA